MTSHRYILMVFPNPVSLRRPALGAGGVFASHRLPVPPCATDADCVLGELRQNGAKCVGVTQQALVNAGQPERRPVRRRGTWLITSTRATAPRPAMRSAARSRLAERAATSSRVQSSS